ncbi:MAG: ferrous iron transport protein A [Oscillospiraceae bacterium]|nr:ferrous iron transport protein A [Oscillospiraceae bacterium]
MEITMDSMKVGQVAVVRSFCCNGSGAEHLRRLQTLGLIAGTRVCCALKSPCGDPKAFLIRGALMSVRGEDSSKVRVELCANGTS